MNYNKIRALIRNERDSKGDFLEHIGMSEAGFNKMMRLETCKVSTLEAICEYFSKSIEYFFDREAEASPSVSAADGQISKSVQGIINQQEVIISHQENLIKLLMEKIGGESLTDIKPPANQNGKGES